ncbi:MAG TPA: hypothetical protein DCF65_15380 [Chloroflexi bacterium]|jgi:hypothetical protein|nr:hypothetical protein [Chloroflexota bacterium]HAF18621.1 hypothetical protein [Chloroflexota bacterium]
MTKWLLIVVAILGAQACDRAWDGPSVPDGSRSLNLTLITALGPEGTAPNVIASTSLAQLRSQVISTALNGPVRTMNRLCQTYPELLDPCWNHQVDRPGRLYLAVITFDPPCGNAVKEASAISGHTLYFIRWVGSLQGGCSLPQGGARWRLFYAPRSDLPSSGILTIRLQQQGTAQGQIETQAKLS